MIEQQEQTDIYQWRAVYAEDDYLDEHDAAQSFASVDQERVKAISLLTSDGIPVHSVLIPDGAQAVFFRRRTIGINLDTSENAPMQTVHCIGWKRADDAVYQFIGEHGDTLLSNDLQAI